MFIDAGRRRHHTPMAVGVERIHVASVIEQWCHGGGVNIGYVVDLSIRLHRNLPVAVQIKAVASGEAALIELKLPPLVSNWP